MRVGIRSKMLILIVLPVVLVYWITVFLTTSKFKSDETRLLKSRITETVRRAVDQYQSELSAAERVANTVAGMAMATKPQNEDEFYTLLEAVLRQNPSIYGSTVAFAPYAFSQSKRLFGPYVYRESIDRFRRLDIGAEAYDYTEKEWKWWVIPFRTGRSSWSPPYFDEDSGNIRMSTYSVPITENGNVIAVATVDIEIDKLNKFLSQPINRSLQFVILDDEGNLVFGDPDITGEEGKDFPEFLDQIEKDPEFSQLSADSIQLSNFDLGEPPAWILATRIPSSGWKMFALVRDIDDLINLESRYLDSLWLFLGSMAVLIGCIWLISGRLTAPVHRLKNAVSDFSTGDFEKKLVGFSEDEIGDLASSFLSMSQKLQKRESELTRMSRVFMDASDPIIIENLQGIVIDMNNAAVETYGWNREELIGKPIKTIVPENRHPQADELLKKCLEGKKLRDIEGLRQSRGGSIFNVLITLSLLTDNNGKPVGVATITKDITALKHIEQQLQDSKRRLEIQVAERTTEAVDARKSAEKANEAKSQFLAAMSHEIRTPMNAITGMTHLLLRSNPTRIQRNYAEKIQIAAQNLLGIINDILDFSKIEAGKLRIELTTLELDRVLQQVLDLNRLKASAKGLNLTVKRDPRIPLEIQGDPLRLGQVLTNLVSNAVKFTESGKVLVSADLVSETNGQYTLQFSVQDTGIGLSKEQQSRLFQAFSQADMSTSRKYGGTGLGLTISKRLVEMMGGKIWLESDPGKGSTFYFSAIFSRRNESEVKSKETEKEGDLEQVRGAKILVVEDNEINQEVTKGMLESEGFWVEIASTGTEGIEKIQGPQSHYDAVLMDLQMPEMNGYEATRIIRRDSRFDDLPVIAMTADAISGIRELCLEAGMNDYLSKPVEPEELYACLSHWIKPADRTPFREKQNKTAKEELPFSIPGIDFDKGVERLAGNAELYKKLLKEFQRHNQDFVEKSVQALNNSEPESAALLVHTLKGSAGMLGIEAVQYAAENLEAAIKEHPEAVQKGITELASALAAAFQSIDKLASDQQRLETLEKSAVPTNPLKSDQLLDDLGALRQELSESNLSALTTFEKLEPELQQLGLPPEDLNTLALSIHDIDFSAALVNLDHIIQKLKSFD